MHCEKCTEFVNTLDLLISFKEEDFPLEMHCEKCTEFVNKQNL